MQCDVLVIGTGLSGLIAAATAADYNKKVIIISEGRGNLYAASGFIDFLGYYPRETRVPLKETRSAIQELITREPEHPYVIAGEDIIQKAFYYFTRLMKKIGYPYFGKWDQNRFLPTAIGAIAPTAMVPYTARPDLKDYSKILVVGFREQGDFYPHLVAENLQEQRQVLNSDFQVKAKWVELGINATKEINSFDVALMMEKREIRDRIVAQLEKEVRGDTLLIVPAVLGIERWHEVLTSFEERLNCAIMEIPTLPPSVTGFRLAENLLAYIQKKNVELYWNSKITGIDIRPGECRAIAATAVNGREINFRALNYILATGGVLGGGFKVGLEEIEERVFKIPVQGELGVHNEDFFENQPFAFAGIKVTSNLQPKDKQGRVLYRNLFIAGRNLYGYDPFIEKSGNGVALVTGFLAGALAARGS
ncbi:anaerobic glycerol-3-phosphate dehydrogenase subunit GlpB [Neomoorella thermoacetica]|uniref:anaerobic glycerol-3-phosphate dehydrogenase subunit GlpB n=1 Tax=Neomoorella thermoacetica TaxID=1525 RepID=UPI0030CA8ECF